MEVWKRRIALMLVAATTMLASAALAIAHDRGRFHDDDPAGKIASFDPDTGMLVIDLAEGGSVAGLVTARTWIEDGDHGCDGRRQKFNDGDWCRRHLHGDDRGRHEGWRNRGDTDELVPGTTVEDALLVLKDGRAFFWKVELDD